MALAAAAMDTNISKLNQMLKTGKLLSDDFLPKFAAQIQIAFGPAAANASNNLQAAINRLHNSILQFGTAFDNSTNSSGRFQNMLEGLTKFINTASANLPAIIQMFVSMGAAVAGFMAVLAVNKLVEISILLWRGV